MPTTHSFKKPDCLLYLNTRTDIRITKFVQGFKQVENIPPFSTLSQYAQTPSPCLDGLSCFGFPHGKPLQLPVVDHSSPHVCARTHPPGLRTALNTWPQPRVQLRQAIAGTHTRTLCSALDMMSVSRPRSSCLIVGYRCNAYDPAMSNQNVNDPLVEARVI